MVVVTTGGVEEWTKKKTTKGWEEEANEPHALASGRPFPSAGGRTSSNNSDVTSYCFYQLVRNEFVTFTTGR